MPAPVVPTRRARSVESDEDEGREDTPQSTAASNSKRARRSLRDDGMSDAESATPSRNPRASAHKDLAHAKRVRARDEGSPTFQPGSIVRVKLTDFVTYTSAEFFSGPNLNMVIGPNGTGKSTLVCAICLGLGWGPQHLGRAKEISEFVKHGSQEAIIEIELAADPKRFRRNPVVCRTIKREGNKSSFTINGRTAPRNGVLDLARSFSIQIDNLCQFLPQDKVVEFAAMTPVELLQSTQQAAGSPGMLETHENLKRLRVEQKKFLADAGGDKELLANLQNRQEMSRDAVERFKQRTQMKERLEWLERCRPIPLYKEAHELSKVAKEKKKHLNEELRRLRREVEPVLRSVNAKQDYTLQVRNSALHCSKVYEATGKDAEGLGQKIEKCEDRINELDHRFEAEVRGGRAKKEEQKRYQLAIRNLKKQMEDEPEAFDPAELNIQIREKTSRRRELEEKAKEIREKVEDGKRRGKGKQEELTKLERDMQSLESSSGQQEVKLQRMSNDTHRAWKWIQENQDRFEQRVYGPPVVECSLKDPKYADAVESLLQNTDFLFFTVQNRNDFRLLQDQLSGVMKLHEVSLRESSARLDQFGPPIPDEQLKELGFEGFALDFLNGPEAVLAMLCSEKRLHQTPIGFHEISEEQYKRIEQSGLTGWVAGAHSYQITRRREYGDAGISSRVRSLRRARFWTDQPIDSGRRRELAMRKAELQSEIEEIKTELAGYRSAFEADRGKAEELEAERKELQSDKERRQKALADYKALPVKLAQQEEKLQTVNDVLDGTRQRLLKIDDEKNELLLKKAELAIQYGQAVFRLREAHTALLETEILHIEAKSDFETLVSRNQHINNTVKEKEAEEKQAIQDYLTAAEKAKKLVHDVRKLMNEGETNPRFQEFIQQFTSNLSNEQLDAEIDSVKAQLDLTHEGDASIVKQFEDREKQITEINNRMSENLSTLEDIKAGITELRSQWEPELDALVAKISDAFSDSFSRIGCAGQVSVHKASGIDGEEDGTQSNGNAVDNGEEEGNGLDFANWAIQIFVKFRETEPLSLLDSHRQSGGERAVSTIFYLMALQSLSRAPFRVVDEINQGMDPRNERMVHGRMVDIACGENGEGSGSQYFLITPKLLSGLKYKKGMKVLCIVSGEQMPGPEQIEAPGGVGKVDFREWLKRAQKIGLPGRRVDSGLGLGISESSQMTQVGA